MRIYKFKQYSMIGNIILLYFTKVNTFFYFTLLWFFQYNWHCGWTYLGSVIVANYIQWMKLVTEQNWLLEQKQNVKNPCHSIFVLIIWCNMTLLTLTVSATTVISVSSHVCSWMPRPTSVPWQTWCPCYKTFFFSILQMFIISFSARLG
jgi:hypothetical protein